jgi:hypothetical protein
MKHLKMLGLVAVAATALMAFLGAGTASATVFCSTNASPCPAGQKWPTGTEPRFIVRPGGAGIWKDTSGNVLAECPEGEIRGKITNSGSATETVTTSVEASGFTWANTGTCFSTTTIKGGTLEYHAIEGTNNGTVTVSGIEITINNPLFGSCVYGFGTGHLGRLTASGSGSAILDIETIFSKKSGFTCPADLVWTEEFIQERPSGTALYVKPS